MNTFLPNIITSKDKIIDKPNQSVGDFKVSDETVVMNNSKTPPPSSSSYVPRVRIVLKQLNIRFVSKIDSAKCKTIRDFVERQLWTVPEIRGKEVRLFVEEGEGENEGYELFGDTETDILKPDEIITVKILSESEKSLEPNEGEAMNRGKQKSPGTEMTLTAMMDLEKEQNQFRRKREEGNITECDDDSSSEDEDEVPLSIRQIVHSAIVRSGGKGINMTDLAKRENINANSAFSLASKGRRAGIYERLSSGTYTMAKKGVKSPLSKVKNKKVLKKQKTSSLQLTKSLPSDDTNNSTLTFEPVGSRRKLLTAAEISSRLVGKMIAVKFEDPPEWFVATVLSFDELERKSSLFYQDGDREYLDMEEACSKGHLSWIVDGDNGTRQRHAKTGDGFHYRLPPPSPTKDLENAERALQSLRSYIKSLNGTLPEGWDDVDIHYYRNGSHENYYISPQGKKHKGTRAVARALKLL